jgi:hypothetical protein
MSRTKQRIFLVSVDPTTEEETHMIWEGHDSLESAKTEYESIRTLSMREGIRPLDGYIYQAEKPPYGYEAKELDVETLMRNVDPRLMETVQKPQYDVEIV